MNTNSAQADTTTQAKRETQPAEAVLTLEERQALERRAKIAEHAYYLALARGFVPGNELDDWLAAERTVDQRVGAGI